MTVIDNPARLKPMDYVQLARKVAADHKKSLPGTSWLLRDLANLIDKMAADHDRRVTELLEADNREVDRRRAAEGIVLKLRDNLAQAIAKALS